MVPRPWLDSNMSEHAIYLWKNYRHSVLITRLYFVSTTTVGRVGDTPKNYKRSLVLLEEHIKSYQLRSSTHVMAAGGLAWTRQGSTTSPPRRTLASHWLCEMARGADATLIAAKNYSYYCTEMMMMLMNYSSLGGEGDIVVTLPCTSKVIPKQIYFVCRHLHLFCPGIKWKWKWFI